MTTMNRLATINVTIDFALPMECLTIDDFVAMDDKECENLYSALEKHVIYGGVYGEATPAQVEAFCTLSTYFDHKYYEDNIDAFLEYQSHMGEPDFDWDFYSDWHKDMYGYRPR